MWKYYDAGPKKVSVPLVCLHGVAGAADNFYKLIQSLCPKGYRIISVRARARTVVLAGGVAGVEILFDQADSHGSLLGACGPGVQVQYPPYYSHLEWSQGFELFLNTIRVDRVRPSVNAPALAAADSGNDVGLCLCVRCVSYRCISLAARWAGFWRSALRSIARRASSRSSSATRSATPTTSTTVPPALPGMHVAGCARCREVCRCFCDLASLIAIRSGLVVRLRYLPEFYLKRLVLKNLPSSRLEPEIAHSIDTVVRSVCVPRRRLCVGGWWVVCVRPSSICW